MHSIRRSVLFLLTMLAWPRRSFLLALGFAALAGQASAQSYWNLENNPMTNTPYPVTFNTGGAYLGSGQITIFSKAPGSSTWGAIGGGGGQPGYGWASASGTFGASIAGVWTIKAVDGGSDTSPTMSEITRTVTSPITSTTFSFSNLNFNYDGSPKTATVTPTPSNATYTADLTKGPAPGSYTVSATATGSFSGSGSATLTINPAAQSIRLNAVSAKLIGQTLALNGSGLDQPYYRSAYGDLNAAFGNDVNAYWSHFQGYGFNENRSPYSGSGNEGAAYSQSGLAVSFSVDSGPASLSGNTLTFTGVGTVTLRATQGGGTTPNGIAYGSATTTTTISVVNSAPRITMSASPTTINFGQTTNLTSVATDVDGNLAFHGILVLNAAGNDWYRSASTDHSTGWGNHPTTTDFIAINYTSGVTSGSSSTRTATHRPSYAGSFTYHNNTHDGIVWASSDGNNWAACVGYAYVTVNKATPTGTFGGRTFTPAPGGGYTVQAGDLNATFANPYSGAVAAPTGAPTYSIVGPGTAVVAGTVLNPGAYTIRASYPGNSNYNATAIDAVWTVNQTGQTITFGNPGTQTFGTGLTLTATASSGLPVSFAVISGPASLSGNVLTFTGTGSVTVRASQAGNAFYSAAAPVDQTFTVNPRPVTFSLSQTTFTYTGGAQGPTVVPSVGGATFTTGGTLSATAVGSYTGTATATGNYTGSNSALNWSISGLPGQTITFANPGTQTFGTPLTLTATASSGLPVSFAVISGPASLSGSVLTFTGTGSVTVQATQAGNASWSAANPVNQTFAVNPRPVTFSLSQTTFTYNGTAQGPTVVPSVGGATFNTGGTLSATAGGGYTATATATGNYTGSNNSLGWSIAAAGQTISFANPGTQTFGIPLTLSATATSGLSVSFAVISGPASLSGNVLTFTGTGSVTVQATQGGNGNYSAANPVNQTFAVNPRPVTFSLSQTTFTYTGSAQGPTVVPSIGGATFSTGGTLSATAVAGYTATATATGNYTGSNSSLSWSIAQASQTITFANPGGQMVGTPLALNATASSGLAVTYAVASGPATLSGTTANFSAAGSVTITASQTGNASYAAATPVSQTFNVTLNPLADTDGDGMINSWETTYGLNPNSAADGQTDLDGDGLTNVAEYNLNKNPTAYDQGTSTLGGTIPAGWVNLASDGDTTKAVGATAGEMSVEKSGALTYTVPIWTTPGTAGMEPKVSLNYSSQAGNGIAGYGWSLSGASSISRGGQTKAIDGQNVGVTISANDRFYLDGQRLILVSGTYGAAGSEYRTELDSFTKVVAYGTRGTGPARFKAQTKAGLTIWYGNADSDFTNDGSTFDAWGRTEPFNWNVSKISDTKGNYMTFSYEEDAANGVHRLTQIDYTGNASVLPYASLRFTYENRADWSRGYSAGSPVSNLKRLSSIQSYFGGSVARTYTLGYTNRTTANPRSLLTSITETGTDNKSYPNLTFEYEQPTGGWAVQNMFWPIALAYENRLIGAALLDLNGDGYPDCIEKKTNPDLTFYTNVAMLRNFTGTGWEDVNPAGFNSPWRLPGGVFTLAWEGRADAGSRFTDFNGDGLVDILFSYRNSNGTIASYAAKNTGSGWEENSWYAIPTSTSYPSGTTYISRHNEPDFGRRLVDINGDGLQDLVWNISSSEKGCLINNINGQFQSGGPAWVRDDRWAPPFAIMASVSSGAQFFDVNGDGLPDMVQMGFYSSLEAGVALNSPTGWGTQNVSWKYSTFSLGTSFTTIQNSFGSLGKYLPPALLSKDANGWKADPIGSEIVDLNGDGLQDVIFSNPKMSTSIHTSLRSNSAFLNTGNGWVAASEYAPPVGVHLRGRTDGSDIDASGAVVVDLNGDGLPDLAYKRENQSSYYYLNTGRGWGTMNQSYLPGVDLTLPHNLVKASITSPTGTQLADISGDGIVDSVSNYTWPVFNLAKPTADRMTKVTNGFGVAASVAYASLLERDSSGNPTVYTKGSGSTWPVSDVTGPMTVVKAVSNDDGVGGQYPVSYSYKNLRSDALRGSLGFEIVTVVDGRTGIVSETTYAQTYPFIGMPVRSTTKNGANLLSESLVSYDQKLLNSGATRFVFATSSLSTTWDLNGTKTNETDTDILPADIDAYGNVLKMTVASTDLPGTGVFTKVTNSTYEPADTTNWILGRLSTASVTSSAPAAYGAAITRTSSYTYEPTSGLLKTEKVQAGDAVMELTTTYGYDQFGNKTSVTASGYGLTVDGNGNYSAGGSESRTTSTTYDGNGRFPSSMTNALNHTENYTGYDQVRGVLTNMTGVNGLPTAWSYDGMGRKIQEDRADGTHGYTRYKWASASAPAGTKYLLETESDGVAPSLAFYDSFGRPIYGLAITGDGKIVYQQTAYDAMGRAYAKSNPYYNDGSTVYWTTTTSYDLLNRPLTVLTPDSENGTSTSTFSYNGLSGSVTDPKGRISSTAKNSQGWTMAVTRNEQGIGGASASTVTYGYDALGNLAVTNASGAFAFFYYDIRGRKAEMIDADLGHWYYKYNVFGELIWQKDAKGQVARMAYDALGRLTSRIEPEGTTTWTYDTAPKGGSTWKGKLHTVASPGGYGETHTFDSLGRADSISSTIGGVTYTASTTYDSIGRPLKTTYPYTGIGSASFATRKVYNAFGFLKEIRNYIASDDGRPNSQLQGKVYWEADSFDVSGRINGEILGNGLANDRAFSASTGRLQRATIDQGRNINGPFMVQDLSYTYDRIGNVTTRKDIAPGGFRWDTFTGYNGEDGYDGLDRLKVHRVIDPNGATLSTVTVDYDQKGNITSKSDVGTYSYTGTAPHALSGVSGGALGTQSYLYDANGNMTSGGGRTLTWTSANQVLSITQGTKISEFTFGAGHERVFQVRRVSGGSVTDSTVYVGSMFEKVFTPATNLIEYKHYIMAPTGRIAVMTQSTLNAAVQADTLRYFHSDGLGSITVVSDEKGTVLKRYAYDAWGKQTTTYTNTGAGITNQAPTTRGFTDHEMLSDHGLVHMNGRIYDPVLGRFLSADPSIDGASDAQGYNRYSYVGNNPLGATDPTGYFKLGDLFKIVAIIVVGIVTAGAALYALGAASSLWGGIVMVATASFGTGWAGLVNAMIAGAGMGFGSGFAGSLLNGGSLGDALKAGIIGAVVGGISAGITFGIGNYAKAHDWGWFQKALAHGTAQGAVTEACGGEFRHGFYSGFFSSAAAGPIQKTIGGGVPGQTIAAAIVGGTAAAIGGGKFANGAVSGAFTYLFNQAAHPKVVMNKSVEWHFSKGQTVNTAGTRFGFVLTEANGTITIQPIAEIDLPAKVGDSGTYYDAALADELEHVADFQAYINGNADTIVKALETHPTLLASPNRLGMIQKSLFNEAAKVATATGKFWDDKGYHHIDFGSAIGNGPTSTATQPKKAEVDAYRLKAYRSSNINGITEKN